jgi:F-type H+-transporting ATPase subunit b
MRVWRVVGAGALLLAAPGALLGAEDGSGVFSLNLGLLVWTWVLFLLTLAVLSWKALPAIARGLETRQSRIQTAIDSARQDRVEAKRLLEEHHKELEQARREAKEVLQQGRVAGERLREEILARARQENEEMLARVRKDLVREREDLFESVRREAVDLSIAAAERLIRESLDDEGNRRLVSEYMAGLE